MLGYAAFLIKPFENLHNHQWMDCVLYGRNLAYLTMLTTFFNLTRPCASFIRLILSECELYDARTFLLLSNQIHTELLLIVNYLLRPLFITDQNVLEALT
jgi:hypothetical protein